MWMVFIAAVMAALFSFVVMSSGDVNSEMRRNGYVAVAKQMATYHAAAVATCGTTCSAGVINPAAKLPSVAQNLTNGRFASYANGSGMIITVFVANPVLSTYKDGDVLAGLRVIYLFSPKVGTWNASTQMVESAVRDSSNLIITTTVGSPFAGYTLHDRQPVIVGP